MRTTRSGRMRQVLQVQYPAYTTNQHMQQDESWVDGPTTQAEVIPLGGIEAVNVRQVWAEATHKVYIRHQGSRFVPNPSQRFVITSTGQILNIVSVVNVEQRGRRYEIVCQEVVHIPAPISLDPEGGLGVNWIPGEYMNP